MKLPSRKLKKVSHEDNPERWLVSYADYMTLLFAFFTILYATSQANVEKTKQFQESINRYLIKASALGDSGQSINQAQVNNSPIEQPIPTFVQGKSETQEAQKNIEAQLETSLNESEMKKAVRDITNDEKGVRISLRAEEIFAENSTRIRREALPVINKVAKALSQVTFPISVESHSTASHWDLSAHRATTLVRFLMKIHQVPEERLSAAAFSQKDAGHSSIDFVVQTE